MQILRAAVVQAAPVPFDREPSTAKAVDWIGRAAAQGAQLAVFPEAFLSGYPKYLDFGARVGVRTDEGRALFRRYYESAIDVPGPETELLGDACREHRLHVVIGVIERDGGTLYCTALFFDAAGTLMGKHRKVMPTAMERLIWGFGDGSTLAVLDTAIGKIGAAICWENYMPLLRTALYAKGVQLYCAPTVDDRDSWAPTMRHIAVEGRCFVLSAVQYLRRLDLPDDISAQLPPSAPEVLIRGGSLIANPFGKVLAGPDFSGETILTADLNLDEIIEGKYDLDVTGHYARPDIFRFSVNEDA
ncbi:MAG: carbon-nitrogen hydrolase family protein [Bryobacteraceae bacterium]